MSTTFAELNLNPTVFKALKSCGYTQPTPIQARSIPDIMKGKDMVACAQTGTGKTAAFVLPALHRLSTPSSAHGKARVLILTPTRELANQITKAAIKYGQFVRYNIVSLVGGMPYHKQQRELAKPVDMIVATPGRLLDHMENRRLDLSNIEMLILDEADRMLDMGFIDDVMDIANHTPKNRQTLLFSATVDNHLNHVIAKLLKNPIHIDLSHEKLTPTLIKQEIYMADSVQHKSKILNHLLDSKNIFKAIIFSATKINADRLAEQLYKQGYTSAALHGDLRQGQRNRTVDDLRRGKIQFLVATDVAARGISIPDISHVINYDLPKFPEDYVHRIGRTGRAGAEGVAISLALPLDQRHLQRIEKYISQRIERMTIAGLEPSSRSAEKNQPHPRQFKKEGKKGRSNFKSRDDKPSFKRQDDQAESSFKSRRDKPKFKRQDDQNESSFKSRRDKPKFKRQDDQKDSSFKSRRDKPRFKPQDDQKDSSFKSWRDKPKFGSRDDQKELSFKPRGKKSRFKKKDVRRQD